MRTLPWLFACGLLLSKNKVSALQLPEPSGPFATGVQDFEFVDTEYPSDFEADASGRRIMFRAWYPICERSDVMTTDSATVCASSSADMGSLRLYFEPGEWEAFFGEPEPTEVTQTFDPTHSYLNAAPLLSATGFPAIIYMHGSGQWVSDNTALLEEIASHGYGVFALASPGFSSGILFPNGDVVTAANDYLDIEPIFETAGPDPFEPPLSADLSVRYDKMKEYLQDRGFPEVIPRIRNDMLALADHLQERASSGNATDVIRQMVEDDGPRDIIYMGYSLGGAVAGSAAQQDSGRAVGAINMDGLHQSLDLFDTAVQVPYMTFSENPYFVPFYYNEFFFEPVETMGTSSTVTRVLMPPNVTHSEFSDIRHLDQSIREALLGLTEPVDGDGIFEILADFCLGFVNTYLGQKRDWTPEMSFDEFENVEPIDVSYVAEWASSEEPMDSSALSLTLSAQCMGLLLGVLVILFA